MGVDVFAAFSQPPISAGRVTDAFAFSRMDPYLEKPSSWAGVQIELILGIRAVLVQRLRPRYSVRVAGADL